MDKLKKLELIQRQLGIRHKLKVYDSMKHPDTHEDLAIMLNSRWELEDELTAIEELLSEERRRNVVRKRMDATKDFKPEVFTGEKSSAPKATKKSK